MELSAPSRWRCIEFISDLHLHESDPSTFAAWSQYLSQTAADAVFILGDLFEAWIGDDCLGQNHPFERECVRVLRGAARQRDLYIMQGNRDFLMGPELMAACGAQFLEDPTVLTFGNQRWLLSHGDALCVDDTDYMAFRALVRSPQWQEDFLAKPLSERVHLARRMRAQSEARKQPDVVYADLNRAAVESLMQQRSAQHMIHGHTHRPAGHLHDRGRDRRVLSDWDLQANKPRSEVLRLSVSNPAQLDTAVRVERLPPARTQAKPAD